MYQTRNTHHFQSLPKSNVFSQQTDPPAVHGEFVLMTSGPSNIPALLINTDSFGDMDRTFSTAFVIDNLSVSVINAYWSYLMMIFIL